MPHLDEGQLHAWLDGAPEAVGAPDGEAVERHLAVCPDCRARLEEARRLRGRAHELLAEAVPGAVEAPPFEAVAARAEARRREAEVGAGRDISGDAPSGPPGSSTPVDAARGRPVGRPTGVRRQLRDPLKLAWAASVVLALGAGWLARLMVYGPVEAPVAVETAPPAEEPFDEQAALRAAGRMENERGAAMIPGRETGANADKAAAGELQEAAGGAGGGRVRGKAFDGVEAARRLARVQDRPAGQEERDRQGNDRIVPAEAGAHRPGAEKAGDIAPAEAKRDMTARRDEAAEAVAPLSKAAPPAEAPAPEPPVRLAEELDRVPPGARAVTEPAPEDSRRMTGFPVDPAPAEGNPALGCYRLDFGWATGIDIPESIELLSRLDLHFFGMYEVRSSQRTSEVERYRWLPFATDSVFLWWSDGFRGLSARLRLDGQDLTGWGQTFADTSPGIGRRGPVYASRVSCEEVEGAPPIGR
ncbi:MAG: anti-sigma factor family protein [Gemmatimonadota bacterium]